MKRASARVRQARLQRRASQAGIEEETANGERLAFNLRTNWKTGDLHLRSRGTCTRPFIIIKGGAEFISRLYKFYDSGGEIQLRRRWLAAEAALPHSSIVRIDFNFSVRRCTKKSATGSETRWSDAHMHIYTYIDIWNEYESKKFSLPSACPSWNLVPAQPFSSLSLLAISSSNFLWDPAVCLQNWTETRADTNFTTLSLRAATVFSLLLHAIS